MEIEINNLSKSFIDKKVFSTVAKKVLSGENRETETLSLAFVDKKEIKKLNKKFRKKNAATDVLSFELKGEGLPTQAGYLGEIIICPQVVEENAKKYGVSAEREMLKVFIHGILHLCGYDHERSKKDEDEMLEIQEKYLSSQI